MEEISCSSCTVDAPFLENGFSKTVVSNQLGGEVLVKVFQTSLANVPAEDLNNWIPESRDSVRHDPTVFDGTEEEAEAAGWESNEFGFYCPNCKMGEDEDVASMTENPVVTAMLNTVGAERLSLEEAEERNRQWVVFEKALRPIEKKVKARSISREDYVTEMQTVWDLHAPAYVRSGEGADQMNAAHWGRIFDLLPVDREPQDLQEGQDLAEMLADLGSKVSALIEAEKVNG